MGQREAVGTENARVSVKCYRGAVPVTVSVKGDRGPVTVAVSVKADTGTVTVTVSVDCLQRRCNCYNECEL